MLPVQHQQPLILCRCQSLKQLPAFKGPIRLCNQSKTGPASSRTATRGPEEPPQLVVFQCGITHLGQDLSPDASQNTFA